MTCLQRSGRLWVSWWWNLPERERELKKSSSACITLWRVRNRRPLRWLFRSLEYGKNGDSKVYISVSQPRRTMVSRVTLATGDFVFWCNKIPLCVLQALYLQFSIFHVNVPCGEYIVAFIVCVGSSSLLCTIH